MKEVQTTGKTAIVMLTEREVEIITYALCKIWDEANSKKGNKISERRANVYWELYDIFSELRAEMWDKN